MMSSSIETTCLSTHYALNKHIHAAFEAHHHQTHRNRHGGNSSLVAYYFGLKYLEIALLEIPQHASFYSLDKTFAHLRRESTINALQVCHVLHEIIANEPQMLGKESRKIEILHGLAMEQFENLSNYENARKRAADDDCKPRQLDSAIDESTPTQVMES